MYFLLSGEGPTDIGVCSNGVDECDGEQHLTGPVTVMVSQLVEDQLNFSFVETGYYGFVSETKLAEGASTLRVKKRSPMLSGKKRQKETMYYYRNARVLAQLAKEKEQNEGVDVTAILFRDSDDTASAGRGHWQSKWNSMEKGFAEEEFERGVPMIPKPKSEAWIICAVKEPNPYQNCAVLENRSGNDNSPNSLKGELESILGYRAGRENLCELVEDRTIDINRIDMPSFLKFKETLLAVL